jgi:hypothetical protein
MLVRDMNSGRLVMIPNAPSPPLGAYGARFANTNIGYARPMPYGYSDERLGLPILAALPALAAKVLPIVGSILPMLGNRSKGQSNAPAANNAPAAGSSLLSTITGLLPQVASTVSAIAPMPPAQTMPAQTMPAQSPAPAPTPEPAGATAPLPLPTAQTIAPSPPADGAANVTSPVTATTRTTDVDTEVVVAPMRVRRPDGQVAVVPMRVRRRRRKRRVRTMRVAPPTVRWPLRMGPMGPMVVRPMLVRPLPASLVRYPTF